MCMMTIAAKSYGFKNLCFSCMAATAHTLTVGGNAKTDNLKQTGKKLIIKQKDIFNTK